MAPKVIGTSAAHAFRGAHVTAALAIRLAMVVGVLLFGGVTWFIRRGGDVTPLDPEAARTLLWVARATWGLSMVVCLTLFGAIRNARSITRVRNLSLVGWAAGEAVALVGGVVWFLTGNVQWYTFGLVYLVLSFLAFPTQRD